MKFNPECWLETTTQGIQEYVESCIEPDIYEVQMQFPGPVVDARQVPIPKTIIHFEIDDIVSMPMGLGDTPDQPNYNSASGEIQPQYAGVHRINFDVGIWSSDRSGGVSSRSKAWQHLYNALGLSQGINRLRNFTDGGDGAVELLRFTGGRGVEEKINDVRVYRMVGGELEVRVFSRTPLASADVQPAIEDIVQDPHLTILG